MTVITRQPELLRQLRAPEGRTLRELGDVFGVSKNTIQRDLDQLSCASFCITEEQRGQLLRYRLDDSARPPAAPSAPSPAELAPLVTALKPWRRTSWFKRLKARLQLMDQEIFDASAPEPLTCGGAAPMSHLVRGLLEHKQVRVTYVRRAQSSGWRVTLEPARLRTANGLLYLDAHLAGGGGLRTFAVHLIKDARVSRRAFVPRPLAQRTAFGAVEGTPVQVEVHFDPAVADFIRERRWHPSEQTVDHPDGGLTWKGTVSGEHEFIGWVMSWSPWAELVSPPSWRRALLDRARAITRTHRASRGA